MKLGNRIWPCWHTIMDYHISDLTNLFCSSCASSWGGSSRDCRSSLWYTSRRRPRRCVPRPLVQGKRHKAHVQVSQTALKLTEKLEACISFFLLMSYKIICLGMAHLKTHLMRRKPWFSGYGMWLAIWRLWVRIPGWTFFTYICAKNCSVCLIRQK